MVLLFRTRWHQSHTHSLASRKYKKKKKNTKLLLTQIKIWKPGMTTLSAYNQNSIVVNTCWVICFEELLSMCTHIPHKRISCHRSSFLASAKIILPDHPARPSWKHLACSNSETSLLVTRRQQQVTVFPARSVYPKVMPSI